MNGKKIANSILLVLSVVLLVSVAGLIVGSVLGADVFADGEGSVINETITSPNNITNSTFSIISSHSDAICNLEDVYNATSGEVISGEGNYTFYSNDCNIILQDDSPYIGEDIKVSYDYSYEDSLSVIDVTELTDGFSGFVTGIVTFLAVIGIIVGLMWLIGYIRPLFSKEEGITDFR